MNNFHRYICGMRFNWFTSTFIIIISIVCRKLLNMWVKEIIKCVEKQGNVHHLLWKFDSIRAVCRVPTGYFYNYVPDRTLCFWFVCKMGNNTKKLQQKNETKNRSFSPWSLKKLKLFQASQHVVNFENMQKCFYKLLICFFN